MGQDGRRPARASCLYALKIKSTVTVDPSRAHSGNESRELFIAINNFWGVLDTADVLSAAAVEIRANMTGKKNLGIIINNNLKQKKLSFAHRC